MKKIISSLMAVFFLFSALSALSFGGMKEEIAVAAKGQFPDAAMSEKPCTSPFFLLFDGKGRFMEAIQNPYKDKGGSEEELAEFLAGKGVTIVVAGNFGGPLLSSEMPPRGEGAEASETPLVDAMKNNGIKAFIFNGSVKAAVRKAL